MRKRAEAAEKTRQRLVEAAVRLHGTVGPRATTMSDVAEAAGVTRATLYRHFGDEDALLAACSAHWSARQRAPEPATWTAHPDAAVRLRLAIGDVYRYFAEGAAMLRRVAADVDALPEWLRRRSDDEASRLRDACLSALDIPPGRKGPVAALVGHVLDFSTWDSLITRHALPPDRAVELMARLVEYELGKDS